MGSHVQEAIAARGHAPGAHLFEYTSSNRLNTDFERICVGFTQPKGGCGKAETVGQTCLVCDQDGVFSDGVVMLFALEGPGTRDVGPLCAACLADFRREQVIEGIQMVDCIHDPQGAQCRWCGVAV